MNTWQFPCHYNTIGQLIYLHTFAKYNCHIITNFYKFSQLTERHRHVAIVRQSRMIRPHTRTSLKTPRYPAINFNWHRQPAERNKLLTSVHNFSPRAEMNKESKPESHTRGPSIKFLLLLLRRKRRKERFYYLRSIMTTPKATFLQSPQRHTPTHKHTCARTHTRSHACTHLLKHTNLKSTSNVFQLAPLTQIINTATSLFIIYHRC